MKFEELIGKRCQHYSKVDDGFYCWKCIQKIENEYKKKILTILYDTITLHSDAERLIKLHKEITGGDNKLKKIGDNYY